LLLGLVHGGAVHDWAQRVIECDDNPPAAFFEVITINPTDLSALRNALWPLVIEPDPRAVLESLFARLNVDLAAGRRLVGDTITILRQMRSMLRLPSDLYEGLNAAIIAQARGGQDDAVVRWLGQFASRGDPGK